MVEHQARRLGPPQYEGIPEDHLLARLGPRENLDLRLGQARLLSWVSDREERAA